MHTSTSTWYVNFVLVVVQLIALPVNLPQLIVFIEATACIALYLRMVFLFKAIWH